MPAESRALPSMASPASDERLETTGVHSPPPWGDPATVERRAPKRSYEFTGTFSECYPDVIFHRLEYVNVKSTRLFPRSCSVWGGEA